VQSEDIMNDTEPRTTFRHLPLTPEQDSEIRHYIHVRTRNGVPWDTPELKAMLRDMLDPPELADEDDRSLGDSMMADHAGAEDGLPLDGEWQSDRERQGHSAP
jgi:hypothetical protein